MEQDPASYPTLAQGPLALDLFVAQKRFYALIRMIWMLWVAFFLNRLKTVG